MVICVYALMRLSACKLDWGDQFVSSNVVICSLAQVW